MIVIVGAGYAGAATAASLARRGLGTRVTLVEAEPEPGRHASGLNAGLVSPLFEPDDAMAAFASAGIQGLREAGLMRTCGSIRLATGEQAEALLRRSDRLGLDLTLEPLREAAARHPLLAGARAEAAIRCDGEGTLIPGELLSWYLGTAADGGARILKGVRVTGIQERGGRAVGVGTTQGMLPASVVVNAAGAWGDAIAPPSGGLGLVPFRRHIFETRALAGHSPGLPWIWDVRHNLYVRMAGEAMWLCWCDETEHPAEAPAVDPSAGVELRRRFRDSLPALADLPVEATRACLRTFVSDRRLAIGPDPRMEGLFWASGLGGTGATVSHAVGELAADRLTGKPGGAAAAAFDPARLPGVARVP